MPKANNLYILLLIDSQASSTKTDTHKHIYTCAIHQTDSQNSISAFYVILPKTQSGQNQLTSKYSSQAGKIIHWHHFFLIQCWIPKGTAPFIPTLQRPYPNLRYGPASQNLAQTWTQHTRLAQLYMLLHKI